MSSSSAPEGTTLGYLHRLGRSEEHTPHSPLTIEQHQHLIHQWNPSIMATSTEGQITTTTPSSTIHKVIEEGAFRLQIKASRGVRYEQPLAALVRYSSLVREWVVAEGITVGATEEAPAPYTLPHHQEGDVPPSSSRKTVQLSPLLMEEDGSSSAASSTAAACDYLCKYHDDTVIILRTTRLTEVSTTAPTVCAPINAKKPLAVYRLEMLVGPSDRPKNVQQSDMAGELMLDSQFLGMMFNYVKKFHKAQCEGAAEPPVLPALLQAGGGSDELLPGQKKKICQIVEVLGLWEIFEEVHGRFRKELDSAGGIINTAAEPDRESVEPSDDAERREEDIAETAKLVEKTMMIAKAKAGETVEIPGAGKGGAATPAPEEEDKSAKGRSVKEHQAHLEWVESFRNKVKALRNFDNAYEDTKDARLAALRKGPATNQTSSSSAQQRQEDSDSDDDGMSAMLLGVGCPLCGRQGHPMAECPYSQ